MSETSLSLWYFERTQCVVYLTYDSFLLVHACDFSQSTITDGNDWPIIILSLGEKST